MSMQNQGWLIVAILAALLLVLIPAGAWMTRRGVSMRLHKRDAKWFAILGVAVVGTLLVQDVRARRESISGVVGRETITVVTRTEAPESTPPDRLQIVAAFFANSAIEDPVALDEVILPFTGAPSEHRFDGLDLRVGVIPGATQWEYSQVWARLTLMPRIDHYMSLPNLMGAAPMNGTGDRPLLDTDIDLEFRKGIALHAPRDHVVTFLVRPLYPGDELGNVPAREVASAIGAALRRGEVDLPIQNERRERRTHPFANLLLETDGFGGLALFLALVFLVGSLRFWPAVAGILFGGVAVLSLATRLDVRAAKSDLDSPDPIVRIAAAGRLSGQTAFAVPAAEAIERAFSLEDDPEVRLALVRALAIEPLAMGRTDAARATIERAKSDPEELVRVAAEATAAAFETAQGKNDEEKR